MSSSPSLTSRIRGSFLGLAVCDALGAPAEFCVRGSFPTITGMQANPNFGLGPGYFTDDTSMALCLARSFLEHGPETNSVDQARKYLAWYQGGYQSSTGKCFDIGNLTREALGVWRHAVIVDDTYGESAKSPHPSKSQAAIQSALTTIDSRFNQDRYCGNGSLMRVLPAALLFGQDDPTATKAAADSSRVTHPHPRCVLSCALYTILVAQALQEPNLTKDSLVGYISDYVSAVRSKIEVSTSSKSTTASASFVARFEPYATLASFHDKPAAEIRSSGYVVDSLEAALWAFFTTSSFREGAVRVVNLGDDADTVGAIYGGLAGAFYGDEEIPEEWLRDMKRLDLVEDVVREIVTVRSKDDKEHVRGDVKERIQASMHILGL
ncbi:hypothetical protein AYO20_02436 [Fonsecaea nubica]|uniref:ADP-ribosylhydrolase ARH3 n=1 Tax=Fonsecaea nubica TaxID=856822 RepID=A0A178D9P2_9EURO|nr:hypothetical protein AYO20_02436 [Fonsecaea nubica]OAL38377.1 hypothetical protein AYO20_02436 [Fonsecaea nubica]